MNTPVNTRHSHTPWLRIALALASVLLVSEVVRFGLADPPAISSARTAQITTISAGRERFAVFKQAQAEMYDTTVSPTTAQAVGRQRFEAFKQTQAEARDAIFSLAPTMSSSARFAAMKERQAEMHDTTVSPTTAQAVGR